MLKFPKIHIYIEINREKIEIIKITLAILFTCGERKLYQNLKKSPNIFFKIV